MQALIPRYGQIAKAPRGPKLLPIFDPRHNLREAAKQVCLLEDHLTQPVKRCPDCIRKHFLTTEALLEEAMGLDERGAYQEALALDLTRLRACMRAWVSGKVPPQQLAQALRKLRKPWANSCFAVGL